MKTGEACDRPRHPFGAPNLYLYGAQRWKGAAALSAAVTSANSQETAPNSHGAQLQRTRQAYSQPLSGREREGGKDSHSRQWRLSMTVFLNRNKRP